MHNPESKHNYFAWPSVARLKNGKISAACSGFRLSHICPFGKVAMVTSEDEGIQGSTYRVSYDNGKTWDADDNIIYTNPDFTDNFDTRMRRWDMGYPATVELNDGSLLTVFYIHPTEDAPPVIMKQKQKRYKEYKFNIGDADFVFFSTLNMIAESQNTISPIHTHDYCELFYVLRGKVKIHTEEDIFEKDILILNDFIGADAFKRLAGYYYGDFSDKDELIISCLRETVLLV